ncbi:hypothetical protein MAR_004858 [Mya arenaria]|uniref:Uncharacterized protein n=2 Tax=Mya arenaria TaxID=6604 RepID=A0ABY7F1Y0_MYAAR|nr:hypothetical protein MAR_004858 [Mya arenaria]
MGEIPHKVKSMKIEYTFEHDSEKKHVVQYSFITSEYSSTVLFECQSNPSSPAFFEILSNIQQPGEHFDLLTLTTPWIDCLQREDVSVAKELIHQGLTPDSYSTFEQAIKLLSSAEQAQRDLCKLVCDDIKQQYGKAEALYAVVDQTSKKPLLVAIPLSKTREIMGYPLLSKDMCAIEDENRKVREKEIQKKKCFLSRESENKMNSALRSAHRYFNEWPNLSRISQSFYRSKGYKTGKTKLEEEECIVLFVWVKGFIPIGWEPFPDTFEGYGVDVRECLPMEMFIGSEMLNFLRPCATLQSPVPDQAHALLALTAGHTFLSKDERKDCTRPVYTTKKSKGFRQIQENSDIEIVFGKVQINEEGGEAFADVARVRLESHLAQTDIGTLLKKKGLIEAPTFDPTKQCSDVRVRDIVMKYGETSKITLGQVVCTSASDYTEKIHKTDLIEIVQIDGNTGFSQQGDSGAYVYVLNKDILPNEQNPDDEQRFTEGQDAFLIGMICLGDKDTSCCTKMIANIAGLRNGN